MSSYLALQQRIARELGNRALADLVAEIKAAILSAVEHYQRQPFHGTQARSTLFTTASGQEFYGAAEAAAIPDLPGLTAATITVGGARRPLAVVPYAELEASAAGADPAGVPERLALYGGQVRLHPVPNGAWPVRLSAEPRLAPLSLDGDSNFWTDEAEELIRSRAKADLWANTLFDTEKAFLCRQGELEALAALRRESRRRAGSPRLGLDAALLGAEG